MTYQYQVAGQTVTLEEQNNLVAVRFTEPAPHSARANLARRAGADFSDRFEVPNEKFTVLKTAQDDDEAGPIAERMEQQAPADDSARTAVLRTTPVFRLGEVNVLATDRVLIGLKDHDKQPSALLKKYKTTDIESRGNGEYTVHLAEDVDPLQVAQELAGQPEFSYAEPDFVNIGFDSALRHSADVNVPGGETEELQDRALYGDAPPPTGVANLPNDVTIDIREQGWGIRMQSGNTRVTINGTGQLAGSSQPAPVALGVPPHIPPVLQPLPIPPVQVPSPLLFDPLLGQQYAMTLIKAKQAWKCVHGSQAIKIAILDEGVDTKHEDLRHAIAGGYDGCDNDNFQEPNAWDGHGTACAGLAAATPNNLKGIRGVAGGCSLLAVRIAYSNGPDSGWVTGNSWIARSVDWAWQHGADVLSNSWGGGAPSNAIILAFERARTLGRQGKGCVIVVAAGNGSGAVSFPATLPNVLAVSATNEKDEFKTKTSSDGEYWWGSNFGPEVDISAPGVHNYTTDITGAGGYNPAGHYYSKFNGTSSSTPLVAGAAALLLSANPGLTEARVRQILCSTADQVGPYPYVNGRNDRYGHGRLNVHAAVRKVCPCP